MVNLLGARADWSGELAVEVEPADGLVSRLAGLAQLARAGRLGSLGVIAERLEAELEELATAPSRIAALVLLDSIDGLRREVLTSLPGVGEGAPPFAPSGAGGDFIAHRPGRSLVTGEAEIASRGYFDAEDRPPVAGWIGVFAPPALGGRPCDDADFWIVAWAPADSLARVRAGCAACPNGALALLADLAPAAHRKLREVESTAAVRSG